MSLRVPRLLVALLVFAAPAFAGSTDLPSQGLENRIEFWKKVYTQYGQDDIIIHDRFYVNLIYDIADRGEQDSKIIAVRQALQEIRDNIATPESLSPVATQIRAAIIANGVPITS